MILDSVGDGMYRGYEDGSSALYATVDESNVLIYGKQWCASHKFDKEHAKCIVHRIPNDFSFAHSARAVTVSCFPVFNFRMKSPPCSTPVCLTAVKIVAKATSTVPFSIRKARGRSGELGLRVCPGELSRRSLACFRRQGLDRCDDDSVLKGPSSLA